MEHKLERTVSVSLAIAAIVIAASVARREFFPSTNAERAVGGRVAVPKLVADWKAIARQAFVEGVPDAPVTIVEFIDLECPYCRSYNQGTLRAIREEFGDRVSVGYLHYPLSNHRFALPAARVAECGRAEGKFGALVDAIYGKQDSLGIKAWTTFARDVGIADRKEFERCISATTPIPPVELGLETGKRLKILGTPTIMVNGWLFAMPPSQSRLSSVIANLLKGSAPVAETAVDDGKDGAQRS